VHINKIFGALLFVFAGCFCLANDSVDINYLQNFSDSLQEFNLNSNNCEQVAPDFPNFKKCPKYLKNRIKQDTKSAFKSIDFLKIDSPHDMCTSLEVKFPFAETPEKLNRLLQSNRLTNISGLPGFNNFDCSEEITKAAGSDNGLKNRIQMNLVAEHSLSIKRLELANKNALNEISNIDSMLGYESLSADLNCRKDIQTNKNKALCRAQKKCSSKGGLSQLAKKTAEGLEELKRIKAKHRNSRTGRYPKAAGDFEKLFLADNPWVEGKAYKKSIKSGASVEHAIRQQLIANREKVKEELGNNSNAIACISGEKTSSCTKIIKNSLKKAPALNKFRLGDVDPSKLSNKKKNIRRKKIAVNNYMSSVQCLADIRDFKSEQVKDVFEAGANIGLTIATGGLGAIAGSARVASLSTKSVGVIKSGLQAGKFKSFVNFAKTPVGRARLGMWSADAVFAAYDLAGAKHACDSKLNQLVKVNKGANKNICPKSLDGPGYKIESDYKSCIAEIALASLGLAPFAPDVVAKLIRGRSARSLVAKMKLTDKQVEAVAQLQKSYPEKTTEDFLKQLDLMPDNQRKLFLSELENFDPKKMSFFDHYEKSVKKLVRQGKVSEGDALKTLRPLRVEAAVNSALSDADRLVKAKQVLLTFMGEDEVTDEMLVGVLKAHNSHGKEIGQLLNEDLNEVSIILKNAGIKDPKIRKEIVKRGLAGNPPSRLDEFLKSLDSQPKPPKSTPVQKVETKIRNSIEHKKSIKQSIAEEKAIIKKAEADPNSNPFEIAEAEYRLAGHEGRLNVTQEEIDGLRGQLKQEKIMEEIKNEQIDPAITDRLLQASAEKSFAANKTVLNNDDGLIEAANRVDDSIARVDEDAVSAKSRLDQYLDSVEDDIKGVGDTSDVDGDVSTGARVGLSAAESKRALGYEDSSEFERLLAQDKVKDPRLAEFVDEVGESGIVSAGGKTDAKPIKINGKDGFSVSFDDGGKTATINMGKARYDEMQDLLKKIEVREGELKKQAESSGEGYINLLMKDDSVSEMYRKVGEIEYINTPYTDREVRMFEALDRIPEDISKFTSGQRELIQELEGMIKRKNGRYGRSDQDAALENKLEQITARPSRNKQNSYDNAASKLYKLNGRNLFKAQRTPRNRDAKAALGNNINVARLQEIAESDLSYIEPRWRVEVNNLVKKYKDPELRAEAMKDKDAAFYIERAFVWHELFKGK